LKLSKQNSNNYDALEQKKEFKAARKIQEITRFLEKILDRCRNYLNIRVTVGNFRNFSEKVNDADEEKVRISTLTKYILEKVCHVLQLLKKFTMGGRNIN